MSDPFDDADLMGGAETGDADLGDDPFGAPMDDPIIDAPAVDDDPLADHTDAPVDDDPFGAVEQGGDADAAPISFGDDMPAAADSGPTPLDLWNREREKVLADRIRKAKEDKEKAQADAKEEITQFYKNREEKHEKTQKTNRLDEENERKDMDSIMEHGTVWQKVAKIANLAPKNNEPRDVNRMRKLLIELKNEKGTEK